MSAVCVVILLLASTKHTLAYDWCPQYHSIRGSNFYDPSGPMYFNNKWHVFQDECEWCHYYSSDLLHWQPLANTLFSGLTGSTTAIHNNSANQVIAFYPAEHQVGIVRAVSSDPLMQYFSDYNLVIPKPSSQTTDFRDPLRPLNISGDIYIGVGSGINPGGPGEVLFYRATDGEQLMTFQPVGSLFNISQTMGCVDADTAAYNASESQSIHAIECPDVFLMNGKYVLIAGLFCTNEYYVGDIQVNRSANSIRFIPETHWLLDYGNFYAAKTGTDAFDIDGTQRRVLFAFTGWQEPTAPTSCGRSFVIPRDMELADDGYLKFKPVKEIESIRGNDSNAMQGSELQIVLECKLISNNTLPPNAYIAFNVLSGGSENAEYVQIGYSFEKQYFFVDHRKCCNDGNDIVQTAPYENARIIKDGGVFFNVLLDRSIIESFFNEERVITSMVNPTNHTSPEQRNVVFVNEWKQYLQCDLQSWTLSL